MFNGTPNEDFKSDLAMKMGFLNQPTMMHPFQQMQATLNSNFAFANGSSPPASIPANVSNNPSLASLSQHYLRILMLNEFYRQQQQQNCQLPTQSESPSPPGHPQMPPPNNSSNALAAAAFFARCLSSS